MELTDFLARLGGAEPDGNGLLARCPAHSDSHASLRVSVSASGKVLVKCRAGCETADVMAAVGLTMRDLGRMRPGDALAPVPASDAPVDVASTAALAADLDDFAAALAEADEAHPAVAYAARRFGLTLADVRRLGLGYAAEGDLDPWARLVVPFRDPAGIPGGYQARALDPRADLRWRGPANPAGGGTWAKTGWLTGAAGYDEVVVTEGPGDALTAVGAGYDAILIRGAALASNAAVLDDVRAMVGDRLAVICGDGDPSGRTFGAALAQGLVARGARVKNLQVPDGLDLSAWYERNPGRFGDEFRADVTNTAESVGTDVILQDRDPERYPFTDLGNAWFVRDFIAARGSAVKFAGETGFYLLDNGVWRADTLNKVRTYAQQAAERVGHIAKRLRDALGDNPSREAQQEVKQWDRWATHSQSSAGLTNALRELEALTDVVISFDDFDRHPDLLAVRNGVVDLRTGALLPHDPGLLLTRRIDHDYHPDAAAPRWERFLTEVFPDHPDMPAFMQRLVGYGITGHTTEQCFAVLWGRGANGKSVFTDTLTEVFREQTVTTPFSTFEDKPSGGIPNDLAALKGARLVMASEGEQGRPMAEAVLKRVTGRDLISARFMRKEFFEFRPSFLLMLATNFQPNFKGQDEGLWRRVKLIPWQRFFAPDERDPRLGATLVAEAEGILAWAVRGAQEWYARGLAEPAAVREATRAYRDTSNPLDGFLPGWLLPDDEARVTRADVWSAYLDYCDAEGIPERERKTRKGLYAAVGERGFEPYRTKTSERGFRGIRVTTPAERHAAASESAEPDESAPAPTPAPPTSTDAYPSLEGL